MILQSKLLIEEGNFDAGIAILNKTQNMAKKYNQLQLLETIKSYRKEIERTFIEKFNVFISNKYSTKTMEERIMLEFLEKVKRMSL